MSVLYFHHSYGDALRQMENFRNRFHLLVGFAPGRPLEKIAHFRLPLFIYFCERHLVQRLLKIRSLHISNQQPVIAQKKRIIIPASGMQSAQHFRPDSAVTFLVFRQPIFFHLQKKANSLVIVVRHRTLFSESTSSPSSPTVSNPAPLNLSKHYGEFRAYHMVKPLSPDSFHVLFLCNRVVNPRLTFRQ